MILGDALVSMSAPLLTETDGTSPRFKENAIQDGPACIDLQIQKTLQ